MKTIQKLRYLSCLGVLPFAVTAAFNLFCAPMARAEIARVSSNLGEFDIRLFNADTPKTVANFLGYVRRGDYDDSIIHRSVSEFVVQGGGFRLKQNSLDAIPSGPMLVNEPGLSNVRGTVAMAKLGGNPNSATNQWFINLSNQNPSILDNQNGGFTVFGEVLGNGMSVADAIAALPVYNAGGVLNELPLRNAKLTTDNLVLFNAVRPLAAGARDYDFDFAVGQHGFTAGFADLPTNYDKNFYALTSDYCPAPAELGGKKALLISGMNHSDDLWMFWRKKLIGLAPGSLYEASFDLQLASSAPAGAVGIGGAPGESVYIKAGASAAEPRPVADKAGDLRLSVDKGNQSLPGSAASLLGHAAKPDDGTEKFALLQRDNRTAKLRVRTAADGSLWVFFGSDSGFEGETTLYYTNFTAVLEPVGKDQKISFAQPRTMKFGTAVSLNATATSGLKVSFASANASIAKITSSQVLPTGIGTVRITASQSGDSTWNAAPSVIRTLQILKGDQKVIFTNPGNKSYKAGAKFTLAATATSTLPIKFMSSDTKVLAIDGRTATMQGRGKVTITASQTGNNHWTAALPVKWTLIVQ
jgi:cyclophilin family peptidyl-prolyl cis-trans isomerase